jgi:SAM-dependent methyltransferase
VSTTDSNPAVVSVPTELIALQWCLGRYARPVVGPRSLREEWEVHADEWAAAARTPGYDTFYWYYNEPSFLAFVPPPRGLTLDVGCGEGRLARALLGAGHQVLGVDGSVLLARLATSADPPLPAAHADASALPVASGAADLVVSFMVLMDVEDLDAAVAELERVLAPGGSICVAILHPINTAGMFLPDDRNRTFYLGEYQRSMRHVLHVEREGLGMTFNIEHRPIEAYSQAFERAGLVIAALREPIPTEQAVSKNPELADYRRVSSWLYFLVHRR